MPQLIGLLIFGISLSIWPQILASHIHFSKWARSGSRWRFAVYAAVCWAVVGLITLILGEW